MWARQQHRSLNSTFLTSLAPHLRVPCWLENGRQRERSRSRLFVRERNADAANNFRKSRITSEGIESGIHPDKDHSKRSLPETFLERGESFVGFSKGGVYGRDVVAAHKSFVRHGQEFLEYLARFLLIS